MTDATDVIREALSALRDAYQEVLETGYPADQQAAIVNSLGTAMDEVEEALRFAGIDDE